MKISESFFITKKEDNKDEDSVSANLLVRAGMIKKIGSGIYTFLPLGFRVLKKIEEVVREEMNEAGSLELVMPSLIPEEYFIASGRRDAFGSSMFSLKDRFERNYVLGPTHEELFVNVALDVVKSYKNLPLSLYQIANKYRDEARSRYGLIRTREFVMKDAYTFDKDLEGLDKSYKKMYEAYKRIFDKLDLDYKIVKSSTGVMGGLLSEEFQAVCDIGEDTLVLCEKCNYATNIEICKCVDNNKIDEEELLEKELIFTKDCGTIKDLCEKYKFDSKKMVKTLIYKIDEKYYGVVVRGDREVNEEKLSTLLEAKTVELASDEEDEKITGANVGFAGPVDLLIPIIIDQEVLKMKNFLVGANKTDYHYINCNLKDFKYDKVADIRKVMEGDVCPNCGGVLTFKKGIEIGNTFKLGTKYSEAMNLYYTDENNQLKPVVMGSYGIGIARVLAALVEQKHDDNGLVLPEVIAPYKVAVIIVNEKEQEQVDLAMEIYQLLQKQKIEIILDDRDIRVGIKFKDMDLIGIPYKIIVGKKAKDKIVEIKKRTENDIKEVALEQLKGFLHNN